MRILFLSGYSPLDLFMGTGEYNRRMLSHFVEKGHEIHYLCLSEQLGRRKVWLRGAEIPAYLNSLRIAGWRRFGRGFIYPNWKRWLFVPLLLFSEAADRKTVATVARWLGRGPRAGTAEAIPESGRRVIEPDRRALIRDAFAAVRPDAVFVDGTFYGDCFDALPPEDTETCKVIVTIDVYHQRAESLRRLGATAVGNALTREVEAELLDKADVIVALQDEEAAVLQRLSPQRQVVTAPLAPEPLPERGVPEVAGRCLFIGSRCDHNEVSLVWLMETVWPRILAASPGATLHVCGRVGEIYAGREFPGVRFLGLVPDLGVEYAAAQVCLVPLRAGSGLKIKTVQALAQNKPCVATGFGAQGMRHLDGHGPSSSPTDRPTTPPPCAGLLADPATPRAASPGSAQPGRWRSSFSPAVCYGPLRRRDPTTTGGRTAPHWEFTDACHHQTLRRPGA